MKIDISHTYACSIDEFWASWEAPEVRSKTVEIAKFTRETIRDVVEDGTRVLEQRYVSSTELPAIASTMIGEKYVAYTVTSHIRREDNTIQWKAVPPAMPEKIYAEGTLVVVPHASGCERKVTGQVRVGIAMMGKKIERQIVDVLGKSYRLVHKLQMDWVESHKA